MPPTLCDLRHMPFALAQICSLRTSQSRNTGNLHQEGAAVCQAVLFNGDIVSC